MSRVLFIEEAEREFKEIIAYYQEICPGLGMDFAAEVREMLALIAEMPELFALRGDGTRRGTTDRFPYQVVYFQDDDAIWIVAVAHHRRFPEYWRGRLE